ncbi:A-kinase-interacting protein 1 [Prinia subflava]|uniref:A-kinase-interacting protein 1 n=1 Tax=Prinia subflava TaxID=208062 RepID=UPI002FE107D8
MEAARAGRTAGLARDVLERARRRAVGAPPASAVRAPADTHTDPDRDRETDRDAQKSISARAPGPPRHSAAPKYPPRQDQDREPFSAAFASIEKLMRGVSKECEKYYGAMAANKCEENEIQHFCKYHGKSVDRKTDSTEEKRTEGSIKCSKAQTCQESPRRPSKDFYIEVSPGIYSITAISEDMVEQTHVVDVNAGQSIDVTFVL